MEVEMCEQRTGTRVRRGRQRSDSTAGGRLSRGAEVQRWTARLQRTGEVCVSHTPDRSHFPAKNLLNIKACLYSHLSNVNTHTHTPAPQLRKVLLDSQPNINAVASPQADMP